MKRRDFLFGFGGAILGASATFPLRRQTEEKAVAAVSASKNKPPNFLILLADDLRWDGIGIYGNRFVQTPHIDQLARNAAVFSNAFVTTSVCPTSRASIMLGQSASQHGLWDFTTSLSNAQFEKTYHRLLMKQGYRVGFVGKWGFAGHLPTKSLDFFDGFNNLGHYQWPERIGDKHLTSYHGDQAVSFIEKQSPNQPFCLTVSFWAPHAQSNQKENETPYDSKDSHLYESTKFPLASTFSHTFAERLPHFMHEAWAKEQFQRRFTTPEKAMAFIKGYHRLVAGMDRSIGRVIQALDRSSLRDNTVIIVLSDNGFMLGEHGFVGKWLMFEESIRIPLIIQFPMSNRLHKENIGIVDDFALNIDLAPTILSLGGVNPEVDIDGLNLFGESKRNYFFYEYKLEPFVCLGIRNKVWKYAWYPKESYEQLFNLENDPYEISNLAGNSTAAIVQSTLKAQVMEKYNHSSLIKETG